MVAKRKYTNVMVFRDGLPGWKEAGYKTNIAQNTTIINVRAIEPKELHTAINDLLVIDIRPSNIYDKFGYIPDSRALPLAYLSLLSTELSKESRIVIVDHQGKRCRTAAQWLISQGYTDVSVLNNGLQAYVDEGFSLEK